MEGFETVAETMSRRDEARGGVRAREDRSAGVAVVVVRTERRISEA